MDSNAAVARLKAAGDDLEALTEAIHQVGVGSGANTCTGSGSMP